LAVQGRLRAPRRAMGVLSGLCGLLLAAEVAAAGGWGWPLGGSDNEASGGGPVVVPTQARRFEPGFALPGLVVQGSFGFDPWEDLHRNVESVLAQKATHSSHGPSITVVRRPMALQIGGLLDAFGDHHAGHIGRTHGQFEVDDDGSRFRLSALLPGYKLGDAATIKESPLSVRVVGGRSVVVNGMQQTGHMIQSWQRSFKLPRHSDTEHMSVTYNPSDGNLTVDVMRRNVTDGEDDSEEESDSALMPAPLRAMHSGLPGIIQQMTEGQRPMMGGGFLAPSSDLSEVLGQVFGMVEQLHPRYHPPADERPIPEDAVVTLVGCFAEAQLAKAELKYYGEGNAANFAAMYWHAAADGVPYFTMSRHAADLGHAFTFRNFTHEHETPQWGVYDGCGLRCADDDARWCGCANEASRGFDNPTCSEGQKRFAVYKMEKAPSEPVEAPSTGSPGSAELKVEAAPEKPLAASAEQGEKASGEIVQEAMPEPRQTEPAEATEAPQAAAEATPAAGLTGASQAPGRPYWQLTGEDPSTGGDTAIEIVVPRGTMGRASGREVLLYNVPDSSAAADPASGASEAAGSAPQADQAPVGKMKLPVGIAPDACVSDWSKEKGGEQVLRCKLDRSDVKTVPIKVVGDEL